MLILIIKDMCFIKYKLSTVFKSTRFSMKNGQKIVSSPGFHLRSVSKLRKARKTKNMIFTRLYEIAVQIPYGKQRQNVIKTF